MKEKVLKISIYVTGIVCLYAFLAIRIFPLMNAVLIEKMDKETREFSKYGDLYYHSCIPQFRIAFKNNFEKYRLSDRHPDIQSADIITYGDSFFDLTFQKNIPELLSDTMKKEVFSYITMDPTRSDPFCLLNELGYQGGAESRKFIYETAERNIPVKFENEFQVRCAEASPGKKSAAEQLLNVIFKYNSETLYDVLLKQSYLTSHCYSFIAMIKFKAFGYISPLTAVYKTQPEPWLFYKKEYTDEKGGFYYQYPDEEIRKYADNILYLKEKLREIYNLDLLFVPVPNKISIYSCLISDVPYNDFLPKLYKELDMRGVDYIDLFTLFSRSTEILYHGTDTHWNEKGVQLALELFLKKLNNNQSILKSDRMFFGTLTSHTNDYIDININ